jgi:mRNA interferase YafQ
MRTIEFTNRFKKDFRRVLAGPLAERIGLEFDAVVAKLANDEVLPPKYADHALVGDWQDHRDCHIRPDLVLIYRKVANDSLVLARIGSHSELGF